LVLNVVMAACHGVNGTIAHAFSEVIVPYGGTVRDIACVCAVAKKLCSVNLVSFIVIWLCPGGRW